MGWEERAQHRIGRVRYDIDLVSELRWLSAEDEQAAILLQNADKYRHAIYFFLQSMEKLVRSHIFTIVDANNSFFRDFNRHHSLKKSFDFFAQVVSTNTIRRDEFRQMLDDVVLPIVQRDALHNDVRYPWYSEKYDNYNLLEVQRSDAELLRSELQNLKTFLTDIERYR